MKFITRKFDLFRSKAQFEAAKWAAEAMQDIHGSDEEAELWGRTFETCPVKINATQFDRSIELHREVVDDFLYRIETQLPQMSEGEPDAPKGLRKTCRDLANRVRGAFGLEEITLADIG